jgi:hypothetical protein
MLAYALVGLLLVGNQRNARRTMAICVALPFAAAALEVLQNLVPGRDPKVSDVIASSTGAWIGIACAVWLRNLGSGRVAATGIHPRPSRSMDGSPAIEEEDRNPSSPASNARPA